VWFYFNTGTYEQNMPDTRHSKASVSSLAAEVNVQGEFVTLAK